MSNSFGASNFVLTTSHFLALDSNLQNFNLPIFSFKTFTFQRPTLIGAITFVPLFTYLLSNLTANFSNFYVLPTSYFRFCQKIASIFQSFQKIRFYLPHFQKKSASNFSCNRPPTSNFKDPNLGERDRPFNPKSLITTALFNPAL